MSYAIFRAAGQQIRATEGQTVRVPLMDGKPGAKVTFSEVLLTSADDKVVTGTPMVKGAAVKAEILGHVKGDKIFVWRFKRRKNVRKKTGHRQQYTEVKITGVKVG
ncbi:MAG: 50S ribosomal protein L21 [Gemmatimonadota bacterium]|nr:50S ribosomal protein L21 [Gemmatimonadota bacterium]MDH5256242.1 50S ribosomal protein L21 [Gammaproteobacteria bacterium]